MLEALEGVEKLGEINRLFLILSRRKQRRIKQTTLVNACKRTAGLATQYPRPRPAIEIAIRAGLLKASPEFLTVTERGCQFASKGTAPVNLSHEQGKLLLGALLNDSTVEQNVSRLLGRFRSVRGRLVARKNSVEQSTTQLLFCRLLQQAGALFTAGDCFVVNRSFEDLLRPFAAKPTKLVSIPA